MRAVAFSAVLGNPVSQDPRVHTQLARSLGDRLPGLTDDANRCLPKLRVELPSRIYRHGSPRLIVHASTGALGDVQTTPPLPWPALRTCYLAAQSAARTDPASRAYYDRKRAEGKHHRRADALLALARRRLNIPVGPCCATTPHTKTQPPQRLDKPMEIDLAVFGSEAL